MTNDQAPMTNQFPMLNDQCPSGSVPSWSLGLRHWSLIGHWGLLIGHSKKPLTLTLSPGYRGEGTRARPLRVLHVNNSFELGGAEAMLCSLLLRTDRERFEPSVVALIDDLTVAGPVI